VLAIDIPSGLSSDGGAASWPTVEADLTVTFAAPKWGHVLPPGCDIVGELRIADIGIPGFALRETGTQLGVLEAADAACAFPPRLAGSHKGDLGHVLVIAGSLGKTGAAVLAGYAALRAGAGLVTVATPAAALPALAGARAELMTEPLPGAGACVGPAALARALELAEGRDAVVLGPGLGQGGDVEAFVTGFLAQCSRPLVLDADGLNAVAGARDESRKIFPRRAPTVLTPHPGEMGRLLGTSASEVQRDRVGAVRRLAAAAQAVAVLKGQRTLVAEPKAWTAVNPTGNPGLATAGSGDVLSGIVGALLARTGDAWLAATAAVFVHGRAADIAALERGQEALVAGDVAEALGAAVVSLARGDAVAAAARL
jgi:NAD(P)H-hydrate epimerase